MSNKDFTTSIKVSKSPQDVFNNITAHVANWWGGKDLKGYSKQLNDEFTINHPGAHYSKQKLVEVIPDKKIVWLVTESTLDWLQKDKQEWTNTKMIFEIAQDKDETILYFTHEGLASGKECYGKCAKGWSLVIKDCLFNFITSGEIKIFTDQKKMENFTRSISVNISAAEAMNKISKLTDWWGVTFSGTCEKQNDKFLIKMGGDSFFNMTVAELLPRKKIVWLVTDCNMPWYSDKKEWLHTKLIFDFTECNGLTTLTFTHQGLTPAIECYKDCEPGWNHWITRSLFSYLTTGKGDFTQR